MIPPEIENKHIVKAARVIDRQGIPATRESRSFDVIIGGKSYPPKYLLSVAARLARGEELSAWNFITTEARDFLSRRDFDVVEKRRGGRRAVTPIVVTAPSFVICWEDVSWRDLIPWSWLRTGQSLVGVAHEMRDLNARFRGSAKCDVTIESNLARFDYRSYRNHNRENEVQFGTTRVTFQLGGAPKVTKIEWIAERYPNRVIHGYVEEPILQHAVLKPYVCTKSKAKKKVSWKRARPGQRKFRETLEAAYGNSCSVTGCGVGEALEGAHIDPYSSPASNHVCNGLLLRADIHVLFDAHLMSVDPLTLKVLVAQNLQHTEYARFQGKPLRPPMVASDAPDEGALSRHYAEFTKLKT